MLIRCVMKGVSLLPAIGEDSIRILQVAIRHVSSVYNVELFPRNYFARRPYLRSFGHRPLLSGYLTRPVLPNHVKHLPNFPQWVRTTGMGFPEPVVGLSIDSLQREGFESDTWSHEDRAKFSNKYMQRIWYWQRRERSWFVSLLVAVSLFCNFGAMFDNFLRSVVTRPQFCQRWSSLVFRKFCQPRSFQHVATGLKGITCIAL